MREEQRPKVQRNKALLRASKAKNWIFEHTRWLVRSRRFIHRVKKLLLQQLAKLVRWKEQVMPLVNYRVGEMCINDFIYIYMQVHECTYV